ncbi:MAG: transglutaminase-like domain-containing protein, partial [Nocardioides sp.]
DDTRFEKAVTLQEWFRRDGGFAYDLNAVEGNGTDELLRFLTPGDGGRTGYCEQFASAMAVLARIVGIPARVAIGFLNPDQIGEDTYEYSAWDLHAWPELFFPGSGWVRFEPTPAGRASGVPGYTRQAVTGIVEPLGPENRREPDLLPNRAESAAPSASPSPEETRQPDREPAFPWGPVLGAAGGGVLLVGLLLLPRLVRRSRSQRRRAGGPEAAWSELRDTILDLGLSWPCDRSPRQTRELVVRQLGFQVDHGTPERPVHGAAVAPEAVEALDRIVLTLERLRYARPGGHPDPARSWADVETCVASLYGGASRRDRRRATWWPRSVLTRRPRRPSAPAAELPSVRYGGVVDHVG